jgi:hypothetical protein
MEDNMASTRVPSAPSTVWTRLSIAMVGSTLDFWGRSLEIGGRYVGKSLADAAVAGRGTPASADFVAAFLREFRHYGSEMALVPWLALERFGDGLRPPETLGRPGSSVREVDGRHVVLPVRVLDAAQGMALYAVSREAVQAFLAKTGTPFDPVDLGRGLTGLAVFGVHHREGDLGSYDEVGVGFYVSPRADPLAIGLYIFDFPVNAPFPLVAGKAIWGYAKSAAIVDVALESTHATWRLTRAGAAQPVLTVSFPRGGHGASTAIPLPTYTLSGAAPADIIRTVVTRTGRGERIRAHGRGVRLELGDPAANASDTLWDILHRLGVADRRPMLHAWTEHMAAEFGVPVTLGRPL